MKKLFLLLACTLVTCTISLAQDQVVDEFKTTKKKDAFEFLLLGDTFFGESYQATYKGQNKPFIDLKDDEAYDSTLSNFRGLLHDSDLNISNLETVITNIHRSPLDELGKEYIHFANIDLTPAALVRNRIDVVSLANNHAMDFGISGMRQAQNILSRNGIKYFGAGENRNNAWEPYTFKFPLKDGKPFKVAIIGAFQWRDGYGRKAYDVYADRNRPGIFPIDVERIKRKVDKIRRYDKDVFIILFAHWGRDYEKTTLKQRCLADSLESTGINAIIGHGSHMAQPIVIKGNKITAFSLGNFLFNSNGRFPQFYATAYSMLLKIIKPLDDDQVHFRFYPIFNDNRVVRYKPRFVGPAEFVDALDYVGIKNDPNKVLGRDQHGFFIEYRISDHLSYN